MTVRVGVISTGMIGQDHIRRITQVLSGGAAVAVADVEAGRANAHRNPSPPPYDFTTDMMISESAVHEIDLVRWMFGEEVVSTSILKPRRSGHAGDGLHDPLIVLLEMADGVLVDVEVFVNAGYGYDIRGEIVGERGTVALAGGDAVAVTQDGRRNCRIPADWRERFGRAFDAEFQHWLKAVAAGTSSGPSSWDGYAAAAVTESCLEALRTGHRTAVSLRERPGFYTRAE